MDLITLVILLLALGVVAFLLRNLFSSKRQKLTAHDQEIRALNLILAGEKEKALQLLKEIGRKDTSNVGVFLQVGDLNRELGNVEAAVRVHQDVLDRDGIPEEFKLMAHERLARDFEELEQYEKAATHAQEILKLDKKNMWALQTLHRLSVKGRHWDAAIKNFQREVSAGGDANPLLPAIYKTQEALDRRANGNNNDAVSLLKQAIKLNNKCATPYYYLGQIKQNEGNFKHAIDFYTTFAELAPEVGGLVFAEIEKMYFELGQFEEVESFYRRLQRKQPDNVELTLALANYYERKGEYRDALALLEELKDPDTDNLGLVLEHVQLLEKLGHKDTLKKKVEEFVVQDRRHRLLTCKNCGYVSSEPNYICDKCGQVEIH